MSETPTIDRRLRVNLQGRSYALYAGVLDLAHELGLISLTTELIQVPSEENGNVAIVKATAVLIDEVDQAHTFTDYGDASPRNVHSSPKVRLDQALIRMASTRAKGRALRDAVNIGDTLLEELPEIDSPADRAATDEEPEYPRTMGAQKATITGGPDACVKCGLRVPQTRAEECRSAGVDVIHPRCKEGS